MFLKRSLIISIFRSLVSLLDIFSILYAVERPVVLTIRWSRRPWALPLVVESHRRYKRSLLSHRLSRGSLYHIGSGIKVHKLPASLPEMGGRGRKTNLSFATLVTLGISQILILALWGGELAGKQGIRTAFFM